jgi:hypothetical protein
VPHNRASQVPAWVDDATSGLVEGRIAGNFQEVVDAGSGNRRNCFGDNCRVVAIDW